MVNKNQATHIAYNIVVCFYILRPLQKSLISFISSFVYILGVSRCVT